MQYGIRCGGKDDWCRCQRCTGLNRTSSHRNQAAESGGGHRGTPSNCAAVRCAEVCDRYARRTDGSYGPEAEKVRAFARKLEGELGLPVEYWDERFSTSAAEKILLEGDVSRAKRKQVIDKVAAAVILQAYLDRQ